MTGALMSHGAALDSNIKRTRCFSFLFWSLCVLRGTGTSWIRAAASRLAVCSRSSAGFEVQTVLCLRDLLHLFPSEVLSRPPFPPAVHSLEFTRCVI